MSKAARRFPVFLTFDLDAETSFTSRDPSYANRPVLMSQGAYGWKTGIWRIMSMLKRYDLRTTFFLPGLIAEQRPHVVDALLKDGHEVAHHSYSHAWITKLTPEQEREEMEKGFQVLKRLTGYAPRGYRSPVGELSPISLDLIQEYGFSYTSNFADTDEPYLLTIDGKQTDIVELCWRWSLDDAVYYLNAPSVLPGRTMGHPAQVLETWISEFDVLYPEPNSMMMIAMHPELSGQPSRLAALESFVKHALKHNVWIGRCDEITDHMRSELKTAPAAAA